MSAIERSTSRGRDFQSSGRGGIGNIRPSSSSRDARAASGPDDFSPTRGREPRVPTIEQTYSTGRGGAGNMRSPSRDPVTQPNDRDNEIIRQSLAEEELAPHSTGRGGLGNITADRSRSRDSRVSAVHPVHSSGRGGSGNIHPGPAIAESVDEQERLSSEAHHLHGIHSTGRGGAANMSVTPEPVVEHHAHKTSDYESTGRGGVGNIHGHHPAPVSQS